MKELLIEQKAKAYDEALARARKVHKYSSDLTEIKRMEDIFPILAESEDEKIRNFITNELACLRATDEKGSDRYEDLTNAITWLEEQDIEKPKQYDIDILEKHITKDYISELAHTVIVRNGWEIVDAKEWSEEDENMIRYIGNAITCKESTKYLEEKGIDIIKAHRWLESFKPQPKQEWSEEDEKFFNDTIAFFEGTKNALDHADWLKYIKERLTWKPSKEQIIALRWVLNNIPYNKYKEEISGLLDQIKNL